MIRDDETLTILLDSLRRFVREVLVPHEHQVAETDEIPSQVVAQMRELGLFGLAIPEAYGSLQLTMEEEVRVVFELAHASPAFRSLIGTNNGIGSQRIVIDGTEEQKRRYLPRLASGEIVGSFALTEPESGSDAASLRTTAVRDGGEYVINGTKRFITNASEASIFTVMARNGEEISTEASCCKLFASEMCGRVADRSVQIHGGAGYVSEYAAERFYRDVRLFRIYEGTSQIQQIVIARNMIRAAQG